MKNKITILVLLLFAVSLFPGTASASQAIIFPVIGPANYANDYNNARSGGIHAATDIFAPKGAPIVAATSGTISYVNVPEATWGYSIGIRDEEGYIYRYIHMNNDTPGTDDGRGGEMNAYAPDMKRGYKVEKGQLLGWVGDSGNAESTPPHLHFEIEAPDGTKVNPYDLLRLAPRTPKPSLYPPLQGETLPYWVEFTGGLNLTMGDLNGDGISESITGAGIGGRPLIETFSSDNTHLGEFFAYDPEFRGGIDVTAGDVDGDGKDEIITGPGPGGGPWVRAFKADGQILSQFAAYDPNFRGGIDVASANTAGTAPYEIITAPGPGGGPWVRVFNTASGLSILDVQVYDNAYKGGVRVSAGDIKASSPMSEIITIPSEMGESRVRLISNSGANITDYTYLESWWRGNYDVAAGKNASRLGTGINRRASMRNGPN